MALLIIFGGLPGSGKTTIARGLAAEISATYLRVDTIEQVLLLSGLAHSGRDVGAAGYEVLCRVASENLRLGQTVIVDSVNPIALSRDMYRDSAIKAGAPFLEVECLCSDQAEHRRRVGRRTTDVEGLDLPTWERVVSREYEPWEGPVLRLDTAALSPEQSISAILDACRCSAGQSQF